MVSIIIFIQISYSYYRQKSALIQTFDSNFKDLNAKAITTKLKIYFQFSYHFFNDQREERTII